jgi:hypothetical protein
MIEIYADRLCKVMGKSCEVSVGEFNRCFGEER